MNTNINEMSYRCPGAVSLGAARLLNCYFRFAQHADIVECDGADTDGVLWDINDQHLKSLDALEGYPFYYARKEFQVEHQGQIVSAIAYYMNPGNSDRLPSQGYLDMLVEGYQVHGVPLDQLENALEFF
jgi:gamma-glutamylcyclotransferase (GGCT)/AIG2-like uncharacterized protein YtfP